MNQFPLQLKQYFFTHIECVANAEFDPTGDQLGSRIESKFNVTQPEGPDGIYTINLNVWVNEETSENPPYFFNINAFGVLDVLPGTTPDIASNLAHVSGTQILMGAIREEIAHLTARGPWSVFMLPFIPIAPPTPQTKALEES